jgi:hypothetical protein
MTQPAQAAEAIDFSHYMSPGVYTYSFGGPQLAVNSTLPTAVGIVGQAVGYQTFIQTVQVPNDTDDVTPALTQTLTQFGINTATVVVANPNSGAPFTLGTDYTVVSVGAPGSAGTSNGQYAISRVIGGHINELDYIQVSYQYTNPQYYQPYIFYDFTDVQAAYGPPFDVKTGAIISGLSLMAYFAFLNGAYQVVCVAVQSTAGPGNAQVGDYGNAISLLANQTMIAVLVTDSGQQPLHAIVQQYVDYESAHRHECRAIVGLDGVPAPVVSSQRINDAEAISDQRIALVCPASFNFFSPQINKQVPLGGQYMAACLAGLTVSMSYAMPLTRKTVSGWTGIGELEQEGQKNLESQNGLMVIEKTRRQQIQVRHGVTTDNTDLLHREWSIIGQQDALCYRLRDYLESDNLIGQPIYPFTLVNVKGSADAALQSLIRDGLIVDYTGLSCRQLATNPDVLEVRFTWLPAFPLNYIVCTFSVSLTTGNVTSTTGTSTSISNVTSTTQTSTAVGAPGTSVINDFGGASNTLQST